MVTNKATAAIHIPCGLSAVWTELFDMVDKRHMKLGKVAVLCTPIVHFGIDIYSEFTAPGRPHILVPNALEICRQGLFTASCNKKISAEVVIHFNKLVVRVALFHKCKSFVCRQGGIT